MLITRTSCRAQPRHLARIVGRLVYCPTRDASAALSITFFLFRRSTGNLPSSPIVSCSTAYFRGPLSLLKRPWGNVLCHLGMTGIDSLRKLRVSVPGVDGSSPVKKSIKQQLATIRTPWLPSSELGNCHRSARVSFYTWEFGAS